MEVKNEPWWWRRRFFFSGCAKRPSIVSLKKNASLFFFFHDPRDRTRTPYRGTGALRAPRWGSRARPFPSPEERSALFGSRGPRGEGERGPKPPPPGGGGRETRSSVNGPRGFFSGYTTVATLISSFVII